MEAFCYLQPTPAAGISPPLPLLYNDGEHTYVCVQTPHGPEYIQRRAPAADAVPTGCPLRSASDPSALRGSYAGGAGPSSQICGATPGSALARDFACSAGNAFPAGESIHNAKVDMRGCKRRMPGISASSSFPNCVSHTAEEGDTCDRAFKHSRSFGYTHVVSSSSA